MKQEDMARFKDELWGGPVFSVADVAHMSGLTVTTIQRYIRAGRLVALRLGGYRILERDYLAFLANEGSTTAEALLRSRYGNDAADEALGALRA